MSCGASRTKRTLTAFFAAALILCVLILPMSSIFMAFGPSDLHCEGFDSEGFKQPCPVQLLNEFYGSLVFTVNQSFKITEKPARETQRINFDGEATFAAAAFCVVLIVVYFKSVLKKEERICALAENLCANAPPAAQA